MQDETAGPDYGELIREQLAEERVRKASLEQRGVTVITTSGVLVSLLFGLAAVVTESKTFQVPDAARYLLVLALVLFVGAAASGIVLNSPRKYVEAHPDDLERLLRRDVWDASGSLGGRRSAEARVKILRKARTINDGKAKWLLRAVFLEVAAVAAVAIGVAVILLV